MAFNADIGKTVTDVIAKLKAALTPSVFKPVVTQADVDKQIQAAQAALQNPDDAYWTAFLNSLNAQAASQSATVVTPSTIPTWVFFVLALAFVYGAWRVVKRKH